MILYYNVEEIATSKDKSRQGATKSSAGMFHIGLDDRVHSKSFDEKLSL
jgi:hypothetical protein